MFKNKIFFTLSVITLVSLVFAPCLALAEGTDPNPETLLQQAGESAGFSAGTGQEQFLEIVGNIITVLLSLLGVIFFVLLIYGGFLWMTSQGKEETVKKAKQLITDAIIGLVIILAAYAISAFVIDALVTATLD
ncbi:MAG: pilin [Patescibacteria group bacterium]|nr:pilin [Patescibacteria group bacterium]